MGVELTEIAAKPAITVLGVGPIVFTTGGDPSGGNAGQVIPPLWAKLMASGIPHAPTARTMSVMDQVGLETSPFVMNYMAGYEQLDGVAAAGQGRLVRRVPPATYAVFTYTGPLAKIAEAYTTIYSALLPASGHRASDDGVLLEVYDERCKPQGDDNIVEIWLGLASA